MESVTGVRWDVTSARTGDNPHPTPGCMKHDLLCMGTLRWILLLEPIEVFCGVCYGKLRFECIVGVVILRAF
jgi:hypothetical protein